MTILRSLQNGLAGSDAKWRKAMANQMIEADLQLIQLMPLFQSDEKTAQRFMWFIGDLSELAPELIKPCLPLLFEMRDDMPFPGMHRSLAKWFLKTDVPEEIQSEVVEEVLGWLESPSESIACQSFAAKLMVELAKQGRCDNRRLCLALDRLMKHDNRAFARRMAKLRIEMDQ